MPTEPSREARELLDAEVSLRTYDVDLLANDVPALVLEDEALRAIDKALHSLPSGGTRAAFAAADDLMNWLNSLDTEGMGAPDVRSRVYHWALGYRGPALSPSTHERNVVLEEAAKVAQIAFNDPGWHDYYAQAGNKIAAAIRNLKETGNVG